MCGKYSQWEFQAWTSVNDSGEGEFSAFEPGSAKRIVAGGILEMNALIDPYATAIVYQKAAPVHRSVGIDMTHQVVLPSNEFKERCQQHDIFRPVLDMADVWFKNRVSVTFHDPLATACVFNRDICEFTRENVQVELESKKLMGYASFQEDPDGKHEVASSVNPQRFFE